MSLRAVAALILTACGRIGFGGLAPDADPDVAAADVAGDGDPVDAAATPPITVASLTSGKSDGCSSTQSTASFAPGSNKLVLVAVANTTSSGTAPTVTLTGNGLTWIEVNTAVHQDDPRLRITLFRSLGVAPSAAPIIMTFSQDPFSCAWSVVEFGNVDTSGTDGSGAIVQSNSALTIGTQTNLTVTMADLASTNNAVFGSLVSSSSGPIGVGAGFAQIDQIQFGTVLTNSLQTQAHGPPAATSADWSWPNNELAGGFGLEIAHQP